MKITFQGAPFYLDKVKFATMKMYLKIFILFLSCLTASSVSLAGGVYQQADEFINQVFDNKPPKAEVLWLNKDLKNQIVEILDHKLRKYFLQSRCLFLSLVRQTARRHYSR